MRNEKSGPYWLYREVPNTSGINRFVTIAKTHGTSNPAKRYFSWRRSPPRAARIFFETTQSTYPKEENI
jgi:hypothetical protein